MSPFHSIYAEKLRFQKDSIRIVVFHPPSEVWPPGQSVCLIIHAPGLVGQHKFIFGQEQTPPSLATSKLLTRHEIFQVFMVGPDFHRVCSTLHIVPPFLQCTNNREQFFVVYFVVPLSVLHRLGVIGNRVPQVVVHELRENTSRSIIGSVNFDLVFPLIVWHYEDWCGGETIFQHVERGLLLWGPIPLNVFADEIIHWSGYL